MVAGRDGPAGGPARGLRRARGDRPGHAHSRRADRLLELPFQGPRLRDAAGSEGGGQQARPAPLHLHGPAPGARHPARRCQPPTGARRLGHQPPSPRDPQPLGGGAPGRPRDRASLRRGSSERGPAGPVPPDRRERERAARGSAERRQARAGGRVGRVRRPRDGQQVHVPLLQRRPRSRGPPRVRSRRAARRPRGARSGRGARVRERRRRRRVGGARPLRTGRRRVGRAPRGGRDALGLARRRAPPDPNARARVALDARVLLRSADALRPARGHGRVRPLVPHRLRGGPRAALRRHRQRARGQPPGRAGGAAGPQDADAHRSGPHARAHRGAAHRGPHRRDRARVRARRDDGGAGPAHAHRGTGRDGRVRAASRRGGRLRQRVHLVPHDPGGVRGPALRGRHHGVRAGQRPVRGRRRSATSPGGSPAARPLPSPTRSTPRAGCGPTARHFRAARPPAASCASRARRADSDGRRCPGAVAPTGSTARSSVPSCRCSAAVPAGWRTVDDDRGLRILWRVDDDRSAGARHPGARLPPARHLPRLVGAAPARPGRQLPLRGHGHALPARVATVHPASRQVAARREGARPPRPAGARAALSGGGARARPHDPSRSREEGDGDRARRRPAASAAAGRGRRAGTAPAGEPRSARRRAEPATGTGT